MDAPTYPFKPIHSIQALALALDESERLLERLAIRADRMYRHVPQEKKGKRRDTYDAHEPLKRVQRKLVDRVLSKAIFPAYLHGGIRDRKSPRSIHSNASVHAGARYVILQDIRNFYPSILKSQVDDLFRGLFGFGASVSALLSLICTRDGCAPQGASTSGYIANLIFWNVEPKIVQDFLAQGFQYSRFADDITISCSREPTSEELSGIVSTVTGMLAAKGCHQKRTKLHMRVRGQGIKGDDATFTPLTVTGLSVFNGAPSLTKLERKRIRSAVKELEVMSESTPGWAVLEPKYHRAMGRVGRLLACGHPDGEALKARLNVVKRSCQIPLLERYQQAISECLAEAVEVDVG
ncbi:reverse transcriptase family protein [Pseudomonas sp. NFACC39-1]|uniref:reverse transcriptase family protein n=1 Tax=Pseudomonas sp. NFACC39-1 TaxID=1566195 RepID=UPI0008CD98EB|nr:reverse transcriptase family protein [Pseudomonas sp. NFACC39-1]SEO79503.1 Reverse transcriptase (RNA-dependent DNA polymerase) [Pseudomonas sp. NFACC39-1]